MRSFVCCTGAAAFLLVTHSFAGEATKPTASPGDKRAPVNEFKGTQDREEVFAFAKKPSVRSVRSDGSVRYEITFETTAKCDATVAIVAPSTNAAGSGQNKEWVIVRHLASGVLGVNAPHPFQQNSLSQKLEWDGADDSGKPAPAGCLVRVSLGLKPRFEQNIGYDHYDMPTGSGGCQMPEFSKNDKYLVGKGADGELYVLGMPGGGMVGRVYKDGKYVKTFWPPSARDVEKLAQFKEGKPGYRFATTTWGDKVLACDRYGPTGFVGDGRKIPLPDHGKAMFFVAGVNDCKLEPWPAGIQKPAVEQKIQWYYSAHCPRLAADRYREEIYAGFGNLVRFNGRTGKLDDSWSAHGELRNATEVHVGPDGLLYLRVGGANYGQWIIRMDHDGKVVPFTGNGAAPMLREKWDFSGKGMYCGDGWSKALKGQNVIALWNGMISTSNVHTRGLYVSPMGFIICTVNSMDKAWGIKHGVPADFPTAGSYAGTEWPVFKQTLVVVFDKDGNVLTGNAVGDTGNGHGVAMDRDGNIYAAIGGRWPAAQTGYDGLAGEKPSQSLWGSFGSLMKFQGGVPFPRGEAAYGKDTPAGFAKLTGYRNGPTAIKGASWIWGGLVCQTPDICTCHNIRYDMDYFARHWTPANQLYSVVVVDANGNRIARLGRYGNVDDTDADVKEQKDGLRFVWPRALAVSDTALYVADTGSRRILKAAISYVAEESVELK
ncbi:MAG: hypothetical protein C0404_14295 [Verrucomicrobia bacterium]|nr:hypothetical protein [Verrucomicrobiota bacterium]